MKCGEILKAYERISHERITDEKFLDMIFDEQRILIQILVDEEKQQITELISYGCDMNAESYYSCFVKDKEELEYSIILEVLYPDYEYTYLKDDDYKLSVDIWNDNQNVIGFGHALHSIMRTGERFSDTKHFEFYTSKGKGDFGNFGGPLEVEFVEEWMLENGSYLPI